jgi:hypothetical protein
LATKAKYVSRTQEWTQRAGAGSAAIQAKSAPAIRHEALTQSCWAFGGGGEDPSSYSHNRW